MSANNHEQQYAKISDLYAKALIELAEESGRLSQIADEVEQVGALLDSNLELKLLLENRLLSERERADAIRNIFTGRVQDTLLHFILVLNEKNRCNILGPVCDAFARLMDERNNIVEVDAYVAARLDESQSRSVAKRIGEILGKEVVLQQYEDPNLIGGIKLRVGDQMIDGSVASQLQLMKRKMIEASRA